MGKYPAQPGDGADRLVVLGRLGLERLFGGAVAGVATKHPPAQAGDAQGRDQERHAHPEPGGHPFTGEVDHDSNYRQAARFGRPWRLGCY